MDRKVKLFHAIVTIKTIIVEEETVKEHRSSETLTGFQICFFLNYKMMPIFT